MGRRALSPTFLIWQVDFFAPDSDRTRFPRFGAAQPYEAVLSAGELLFIPQYWWHHIENTSEGCVSLNFWFKDQSRPAQVTLPLLPHQDLAMRRNIERMVGDRLGARAAQLALPSLPSPKTAEAKALREEVVHLLRHVVAEENIDEWIEGLVGGGHFSWLTTDIAKAAPTDGGHAPQVGGRFALPPPLAA